ncbi:flavonol 3-sulfotransferase [Lactuca sativa]|uniref:Sulfotransferase n=1 Tax=Lactuca sativa TaxID=4236 RepID=A0A9R1W682_LACSA|nr:flavonol 3-sulfotransferase [Lactuca sativa]KAJ0216855.1 hypothetical protein LSAT_V11C300104120 [Lactuca sativa]
MEGIYKTLPQHTYSWSQGRATFYKYQGFWNVQNFPEKTILAQSYQAQPSDILLCSCPKTGTTWLKALSFAILTREKFDHASASPLLTTLPHDCVLFLENHLAKIKENPSDLPLLATHLPYSSLPKSVIASNCKIVYIYRNIKDVLVSYYHFVRELVNLSVEDAPFEEAFDDFCQGISSFGPYWDHILEYWKASQERPDRFLFLKYEDLKKDASCNVKQLAEFLGCPFSVEEEKAGVLENIINLCSFDSLSNLEVNKSGMYQADEVSGVEHRLFFRKAKDGDWENYFTDEMKEKIDKLIDEKMSGTGLVLK